MNIVSVPSIAIPIMAFVGAFSLGQCTPEAAPGPAPAPTEQTRGIFRLRCIDDLQRYPDRHRFMRIVHFHRPDSATIYDAPDCADTYSNNNQNVSLRIIIPSADEARAYWKMIHQQPDAY